MTYSELNEAINEVKKNLMMDTEVVISRPSGIYTLDGVVFDEDKKQLVLGSTEEERQFKYRIQYLVTKDHGEIIALDTQTEYAGGDNDIILDLDTLGYKYLKNMGIEGEIQDKTGSVKVVSKRNVMSDVSPKTGKKLKKAKEVEVEESHYFKFKILEVMREIDSDNDVYIRVWKNGYVA